MTTRISILNHGPEEIEIHHGNPYPISIRPGQFYETHCWHENKITIVEVQREKKE